MRRFLGKSSVEEESGMGYWLFQLSYGKDITELYSSDGDALTEKQAVMGKFGHAC